jgi:hypothetical protein
MSVCNSPTTRTYMAFWATRLCLSSIRISVRNRFSRRGGVHVGRSERRSCSPRGLPGRSKFSRSLVACRMHTHISQRRHVRSSTAPRALERGARRVAAARPRSLVVATVRLRPTGTGDHHDSLTQRSWMCRAECSLGVIHVDHSSHRRNNASSANRTIPVIQAALTPIAHTIHSLGTSAYHG